MKKQMIALLLLATIIATLTGCGCQHEWGKWAASGDTMSRSCSLCQQKETSDVDHQVLASQYIVGHWNGYVYKDNDGGFQLDSGYAFAQFNADGTYTITVNGEPWSGTWESDEYDPDGSSSDYVYLLEYSDAAHGSTVFLSGEYYNTPELTEKGAKTIIQLLGGDKEAMVFFVNWVVSE